MKYKEIKQLLENEIKWCEDEERILNFEQKKMFMGGLKHALYLIGEMNRLLTNKDK